MIFNLVVSALITGGIFIFFFFKVASQSDKISLPKVMHHVGATFEDETVYIGHDTYTNCIFKSCKICYTGFGTPVMEGNTYTNCSAHLIGPAANTILTLGQMYKSGFDHQIDELFMNITNREELEYKIHGTEN